MAQKNFFNFFSETKKGVILKTWFFHCKKKFLKFARFEGSQFCPSRNIKNFDFFRLKKVSKNPVFMRLCEVLTPLKNRGMIHPQSRAETPFFSEGVKI
jgi:hypothetical protein